MMCWLNVQEATHSAAALAAELEEMRSDTHAAIKVLQQQVLHPLNSMCLLEVSALFCSGVAVSKHSPTSTLLDAVTQSPGL